MAGSSAAVPEGASTIQRGIDPEPRKETKVPLQISFAGKNAHVPDALQRHAEEKFHHLEKFFRRLHSAEVVRTQTRNMERAEVTLRGDGLILRADEKAPDLRSAVDAAIDKIERQLVRHKERLIERHRIMETLDTEPQPAVPASAEPLVVRRKRIELKPMDLREALLQMELLAHDFFVFLSAESSSVNVLYRREKGGYGLIEPVVAE
jgi:putative sigma-54 modulation protein